MNEAESQLREVQSLLDAARKGLPWSPAAHEVGRCVWALASRSCLSWMRLYNESRSLSNCQRAQRYRRRCGNPALRCRCVVYKGCTQPYMAAQAVREEAAKALRARDAQLRALQVEVENLLRSASAAGI